MTWQHPHKRGQTVAQRLARLRVYLAYYKRNAASTPGQRAQTERYQDEIRYLQTLLDGGK